MGKGRTPAVRSEVPVGVGALLDVLHDDLTGLLTRPAWLYRAQQALETTCSGAVLLLDVDDFKSWNDRHGHLVGDRVLAAVAHVGTELRHVDVAGRWGGDELVVLLDGRHDVASTVAVGERLRRRVADLRIELPGRAARGPSISIGGAPRRAGPPDLLALIELADREMYRAKRSGRNAVRGRDRTASRVPLAGVDRSPVHAGRVPGGRESCDHS